MTRKRNLARMKVCLAIAVGLGGLSCGGGGLKTSLIQVDVVGDRPFVQMTLRVSANDSTQRIFSPVTFDTTLPYRVGLYLPSGVTGTVRVTATVDDGVCVRGRGALSVTGVAAGKTIGPLALLVQQTDTCEPIPDGPDAATDAAPTDGASDGANDGANDGNGSGGLAGTGGMGTGGTGTGGMAGGGTGGNGGAGGSGASSCAELRAANPTAGDGPYTLFLDGRSDRPYQAYCADMAAGTPLTYLTLIRVGGINNTSSYDATTVGTTTVVTTWSRVRFDPAAVAISPSDFRFSQSTGSVTHEATTRVPYGVARDCSQTGTPIGVANVDLRGLPFAAIPNWLLGGYVPLGSTTLSAFNQVVAVLGGGSCGWNAPGGDRLGATPISLRWCPSPSTELCDGLDNDCDGVVDNGCP